MMDPIDPRVLRAARRAYFNARRAGLNGDDLIAVVAGGILREMHRSGVPCTAEEAAFAARWFIQRAKQNLPALLRLVGILTRR